MFSTKSWVTGVCLSIVVLMLSGCWTRGHRILAPTSLSVSLDQIILQGIQVSASSSYDGDLVTDFSVEPDLPAGLQLDPVTGVISGNPEFITPTATFRLIARNAGGEAETFFELTVNPQAPCGLFFAEEDIKYVGQISEVFNAPSFGCGPVAEWTIEPVLPEGLLLDPESGVISGVPTGLIPRTEFTVIASNVTGFDVRSIFIEVETPAPCALSYSDLDTVYPPTVQIIDNVPTSACGAVENFEITPALPEGLALDPLTGVITGVPAADTDEVTYTITASNQYGADSTQVTLRVSPVFTYQAEDFQGSFDPMSGFGSVQTRLMLKEGERNATFPTPILGLSLALEHDPNLLTPISVMPGAGLFNGEFGPDFFEPLLQAGVITVGIVPTTDLMGTLLTAETDQEVALVEYETINMGGDSEGETNPGSPVTTQLIWGNPFATPPVQNEVALSGTYAVIPVLIDSNVSLTPLVSTPESE